MVAESHKKAQKTQKRKAILLNTGLVSWFVPFVPFVPFCG
jgi:hypothetical protein